MTIKNQKPIIFENRCGCIVNYDDLEQAILWYSDRPLASKKSIYIHQKYPCVSISKEKIHVHRLLGMYYAKEKFPRNIYVHHIDRNRLNALKNNLETIEDKKHCSMHNKGRKFTKEHVENLIKHNKKRKGKKLGPYIKIPLDEIKNHLKEGKSILAISKIYGCDWNTIKARIVENPELLEGE